MSDAGKAVFLSYASQDKEAAAKICDALRAAGVEVWFDQSELRGGDSWDAKIRRQIKECALFVPIISANTNARPEGYFRLEWKLAVDRSHLLADDHPFLFPVVIDDSPDALARVPDKFRDVQWTRLNVKDTPETLALRVGKLLGGDSRPEPSGSAAGRRSAGKSHWMRNLGMILGLTIGLVYALRPLWAPARRPEPKPGAVAPAVPAAPPAPQLSEARRLAEKARVLFDKIDSNADDYAVAESLLKRALELDATDGVIWAYSARLNAAYLTRSFERGTARAETARNHAERAVKLAPESAEAWHALGRAIWRSDPPRAEEALRHALQLAPDDGRILISLGSIYRNQGRDEDALAFYVRAAAQPEVKSLALYDQFLIHLYLRRFAEADRCGREAGAVLPTTNSITGLALLEIVWHGRVDSAQRTLDAAPAAMRSEPRMVFAAALAALMAKQSDEALRALDRLPGDFISDAWYSGPKALFVGLAHAQAGRPEAARTAWEAGLTVVRRRLQEASNDPELHLRLGELLAWTGQAEPALHEARVFEELSRARTDWTASSARIYAALGRADDAVPILEKFLTVTATGRWPLTPALLRLDPLWDKIRDDPRFQKLCEEPATPGAAPIAKVDDKSVAVLAFANLSDDKANEYFSDGISEELLNVLAKVPGLKVTARTSSFHFKGKDTAIKEIAQQLGVAYVVEGSVRKAGDKVRITAQLIKAADGFHVWSDTFTRDLKDIFAVQDEIATLIAQNLEMKMGVAAAKQAVDPEAYRLYLEAQPAMTLRTAEGYDRAEQLLTRAVERDPGLVPAQAALAAVWTFRGQQNGELASADGPLAKRILAQAEMTVRLGPAWAEAQAVCGLIYSIVFRFAEAEQCLRRAVQINPSYAPAHLWLGRVLLSTGRMDEALVELKQATELDPLSHRALDNYAFTLLDAGQPEAALRFLERALQLQPDSVQAVEVKADALARIGRTAEALAIVNPRRAESIGDLEYTVEVYYQSGRRAELEALLTFSPRIRSLDRFYTLVALGRNEEALAQLDSATLDWGFADTLLFSPLLDPIRRDPRFQAKLQSSGFAEFHARAQAWRAAHPPEKPETGK